MRYQAIAFDLDGTLLTSNATILAENKQAIARVRELGVKVFIVTGRHHTAVRPFYAELGLDTPVICCNGTYLYDFAEDKVLWGNPLSRDEAAFLIKGAQAMGIHTAVYTRDAMTYEVLNPHFIKFKKWVESCPEALRPNVHQADFNEFLENDTLMWKVLISDPDLQKMQTFVDKLPLETFSPEWSWIDRVDITRQGNSKGSCLLTLLKQKNILPENVIAFGDNFNDVSMLSAVGLGIAMGNAEVEVQQQAKMTIGSNNEPAIATVLATLIP